MKRKKEALLLLPSFAGFMAFFLVPFVYSFKYAFTENAFTGKFVGLDNFVNLFKTVYFRLAFKNTLLFTLVSVPLIMLLSLIVAVLIAEFAKKMPFIKNMFFIPVLLPSATIVMVWQAYFSNAAPFVSLTAMYLWKYMGLNVMLILTALAGTEKSMLEAAKIDGAGRMRITFSVTLPNIMPTLFFTFILSVVNSFKIFRESYLMWGNHPNDRSIYMLQNYLNNHFEKLNYQNISTAAIVFAIIVYTFVAVMFRLEKRWSDKII